MLSVKHMYNKRVLKATLFEDGTPNYSKQYFKHRLKMRKQCA